MATDVNQAYFSWSQQELSERDGSQAMSVSQMLKHGSISFGRFEIESLSWEKWSVFSHDRRQEELEKFNGLVAEKKAYFEEYYRKIRALKSSQQQQQNQQTELTLDYGCDGSASSHAGDEDELTSQHESLGHGMADVVDSTQEKTVRLCLDLSCSKDSEHIANPESVSPKQSSSRGSLEKTELERSSDNVLLMPPLITESMILHESQNEIKDNNCNKLEYKENDKVQHLNAKSDAELATGSHKTGKGPTNPSDGGAKRRLGDKLVRDNVKAPSKKTLGRSAVTKESAVSVQSDVSLKPKTKPNKANSSQKVNHPVQKILNKTESSIQITKESSRLTSTDRLTPLASHIPRPELRSKVRAPPPPPTASAAPMDLKTSNRVGLPLTHARGGPTMQGTSKNTTTPRVVKSSRMESKREARELLEEPKLLDSRTTSLKTTQLYLLSSTKPRSINLPPSKKSSSRGGSELPFMEIFTRNKNKEANKEMIPCQGARMKHVTPLYNDKAGLGLYAGTKPRACNSSLSGRKPKKEERMQDR